jgi:23S rRNA (pseudouridine1915-N3)-methyltransferase
MKLHIVTIGEPHLAYAKQGWAEYIKRLGRFHQIRTTHLADKFADNATQILAASDKSYRVVLEVTSKQLTSEALASFLDKRSLEGREVCFIIGGPNGLPQEVITSADMLWSLSELTFPHDLAMLILAETLYRSSTISAGHPYHRA